MTYQQPPYQDPNSQYQQQYQQPQYQQQYAAPAGPTWSQQKFVGHQFTLDLKIISFGNKYYLYDGYKNLIGFVAQKLFTIRDDIRIFTDESMAYEMMRIKQEQIIDFSGSFQVIDTLSGELIGILQRKGIMSMVKDEWQILDRNRQEIGLIRERGGVGWFLRRFILPFLPYQYDIYLRGQPMGVISQRFKIIGSTFDMTMTQDPNYQMDRRLAVTCCLLMGVEEREHNR
jgi:hypothetical protein